jgi:hypothetical protein
VFVADVTASASTDYASALHCWTQVAGVTRIDGATLPAATNWLLPVGTHRDHVFVPCVRAGAAAGAPPRACVYDVAAARWLDVLEESSRAPVYAPYASGSVVGGSTYLAATSTTQGTAALWSM